MITIHQAKEGASKYIDRELLPKLDGFKKIALASYAALALENFGAVIEQHKNDMAVSVLHIFDESGNLDIDKLYNTVRPRFNGRQKLSLPMIGDVYFDESDVDKMYSYMRGDVM